MCYTVIMFKNTIMDSITERSSQTMNHDFKARNRTVGRGLYYLFMAEILSFLSLINILGWVVSLASAMISVYALYTMMKAEPKYRTAFYLTGISVAVALAYSYSQLTALPATVSLLLQCGIYVVNLLMIYHICTVTGTLVEHMDASLKERSAAVWKLFMFSDLLSIARTLLANAPETIFTSEWMDIAAVGIAIAAGLLYLFFLWQCQKILQK